MAHIFRISYRGDHAHPWRVEFDEPVALRGDGVTSRLWFCSQDQGVDELAVYARVMRQLEEQTEGNSHGQVADQPG